MAHGAAQAIGAGAPGDLWSVATSSAPGAWIVRPDEHLASSLSLTDADPGSDSERLPEMVGRAAGRGRGSAPG